MSEHDLKLDLEINESYCDLYFTVQCFISSKIVNAYEGPAKSFVTGFGLLQCYVLSNIFLLQTFKVFPIY